MYYSCAEHWLQIGCSFFEREYGIIQITWTNAKKTLRRSKRSGIARVWYSGMAPCRRYRDRIRRLLYGERGSRLYMHIGWVWRL